MEESTTKDDIKISLFKKIITSPYMGFWGTLFGLIGIGLATYYYIQSISERELVYAINPSKALVVDSRNASDLRVSYNNEPVSGDVIAVQIEVWNKGKLPIKSSDILQDIAIKATDTIKILEASIRKISRNVTNFSISKNDQNNIVKLRWDILEKNDGAVMQILYNGKLDTKFYINGIIVGQNIIEESIISRGENPWIIIVLGILTIILSIFNIQIIRKTNDVSSKMKYNTPIQTIVGIVFLGGIVVILIGIYSLIFRQNIIPLNF